MAVTIDASVGGVTANSYVTSDEVDAYAETSAYASAWTDLGSGSNNDKNVLIVRAAKLVDTITFPNRRVTSQQSLQWPRYGVDSPDGFIYPTDQIPPAVKNAQMELAAWLASQVAASSDDPALDPFLGLSSVGVGPVRLGIDTYGRTAPTQDFLARVVVPILRAGLCVGPAGSVRLIR